MKAPAYVPSVTLAQIISYGWAAGFQVKQTVEEAESCGFDVTEGEVLTEWKRQDEAYDKYCQSTTNQSSTKG